MQPDLIGGRYRVGKAIGQGGMGTVWLARDEILQRDVAVKQVGLLPGESVTDSARALREARSSAALSHRNVVTVFDVVEEEGAIWLVMEHVPVAVARRAHSGVRPAGPGRGRRHRRTGRRRAGRRARRGDHPPRRQAGQRAASRRRSREDQRLRHRPHRRRPDADPVGARHRHPVVLLPRAGPRCRPGPGFRRVGSRRHPVRRRRGPVAVPRTAERRSPSCTRSPPSPLRRRSARTSWSRR